MSATSSYELKICVISTEGKETAVAQSWWEDDEWDGGALERTGVKQALKTVGSGQELMLVIENAYYNRQDLRAPADETRLSKVEWLKSEELKAMDSFSQVKEIILKELTYFNSTGDSLQKTVRITGKTNKNLASSQAKR